MKNNQTLIQRLTNEKSMLHYLVMIPVRVSEMFKGLAIVCNYYLNKIQEKEVEL